MVKLSMATISIKKEKRDFLLISAAIIVLFLITGFTGLFLKLDLRLYDFLLTHKQEIPQNDKVVMIQIDNDSLSDVGQWPWTRNILGDTLIRMKELGAKSASFDIEYLSPSALGVASDVREKIGESVQNNEGTVVSLLDQLSDAVVAGFYSPEEIKGLISEMKEGYIYPSYDGMEEEVLNDIYFDYDEYFARALQFFGNSYLTINFRTVGIEYSQEYLDYIKKRFLRYDIEDSDSWIKKGNNYEISRLEYDIPDFCPAIETLMTRAKGAAFTNSVVDDDGIRRRIEIFNEYQGGFVGQLSVAPVLDNLEVEKIIRNKRSIKLVNARFPDLDKPVTIKIPLDEKGYFLINFRHGEINQSFKYQPVLALRNLDVRESKIVECLSNLSSVELIDESGQKPEFFTFASQLDQDYRDIQEYKSYLLSLCTGYDVSGKPYDGITPEMYEEYFGLRKTFFENIQTFISSDLETPVYDFLNKLAETYSDNADGFLEALEFISGEFDFLKSEFVDYVQEEKNIHNDLDGAYCIIGNTATSTTDIGAIPFIKKYANVGIHGNIMNTILERKFIYSFDWYWLFLAAVVISLIPVLVKTEKDSIINTFGGILYLIFIVIVLVLFIFFSIYFPMVNTFLYLIITYLTGVLFRFINSDKEKKFITNAFSQCLSKDVVQDIIRDSSSFKLGGDSRDMTAIFTDIQKFSAFSELLNAAQLVELLNYYLTKMSEIIIEEKGTIDKYEGDAIIALVGAPATLPDHAFKACSAAIKMKQAEEKMNAEILEVVKKDKPENMNQDLYNAFQIMVSNKKTLFTRIGINSGEMVAGFMGSENKKNYTMMGNNVNLASRLEGVNKVYASSILCSQKTWEWADQGENKDKIIFRRLDRVRVINIKTPVQLYNLIGFTGQVSAEQKKEIDMFHAALDMYLERNFIEAGKLFLQADKVFHDETALIFAERCKKYLEEGIPENWDGVLNMTTK